MGGDGHVIGTYARTESGIRGLVFCGYAFGERRIDPTAGGRDGARFLGAGFDEDDEPVET